MTLETHMKCKTKSNFFGGGMKNFAPKIDFFEVMEKCHIWDRSCSWNMDPNALDQSHCTTFKWNISVEQNNGIAWFSACWYNLTKIKGWSKNIGVSG